MNYSALLNQLGFALLSDNDEGFFTLGLEARTYIASFVNTGAYYGKFFFGKAGLITAEWAPHFAAIRQYTSLLSEQATEILQHFDKPMCIDDISALLPHRPRRIISSALQELEFQLLIRYISCSRGNNKQGWPQKYYVKSHISLNQLRPRESHAKIKAKILSNRQGISEIKILSFIQGGLK